MQSQAIVEYGRPLATVTAETPVPKGKEVLVKVLHCGVCHSDVHFQDGHIDLGGGRHLPMTMPLPHTPGHEIVGEVIALGPDASGVQIGDTRAVFPWIGCGECAACQRGDELNCATPRNIGVHPGAGGGFSTHVVVPDPRYLLDFGELSPELAATLMCSGLTAFSAVRKVGALNPGDSLVIVGCGGVGLSGIGFAKALTGVAPIAADIDDARLDAALKAGAGAAYNTRTEGAAEKLVAATGGGANAVVDFVGSEASFAFARSIVRKGGKIVVVGLFGGALNMPLALIPLRAITIQGSFVGTLQEAKDMIALVRKGGIVTVPTFARTMDEASQTLDDLRAGTVTGRIVLHN